MVLHTLTKGGGLVPPESFSAPKVYNILPYLDHNRMLDRDGIHWTLKFAQEKALDRQFSRYHRIANTRNPFSRLYSAWHDKDRVFDL